MTIRVDLLRPDDLLTLRVDAENLKLDAADPAAPALVPDDVTLPSYLIVHFPPQTIVEEAFYQTQPTTNPLVTPPGEASKPFNKKPTSANLETPGAAGARARIGGPSRLVFRVPPGTRIPYNINGLLDWTNLSLNVSPLADVPEDATEQQALTAPGIAEPDKLDTALELPYQMILSPAHDVVWDHARGLKTHAGRTELWHTRLALKDADGRLRPLSRLHPAPLRAIWSPDYNSKKFETGDAPLMGEPDQDWDHPPGVLTAMTPSDRHELVILTSAFHGFIKGFRNDLSIDYASFRPTPVHAEQLILSPLGGWLRSHGNWDPPMHWRLRLPGVIRVRRQWDDLVNVVTRRGDAQPLHLDAPGPPRVVAGAELTGAAALAAIDRLNLVPFLGEHGASLNISEWGHIATQGRDHYVRIVYEGVVYPCKHRAALVKVTERKISEGVNGAPVAYLAQRLFVVIRKPLMDYSADRAADAPYRRHMPLNRVRLTTLVTPDIDQPKLSAVAPPKFAFWINVNNQPFRFHAVGEDIVGNQIDFTTALIFVPFSEIDAATLKQVRDKHVAALERRACPVPGQQVTFAARQAGHTSDNTTLTTRALYLDTDANGAAFRPHLLKATVRLPAVEQLLGTDAPTEIAYYPDYLLHDFGGANSTGLFAHIAKETAPGVLGIDKVQAEFAADQAGGLSTPNLSISGLTRELGPLAGDDLAKLAGNDFNAADFFKDVKDKAKLFGSISLADLLTTGSMNDGAPKVQLSKEDVPGSPNKKRLVATLDWKPGLRNASAGIVQVTVEPAAVLTVKGRVERLIEIRRRRTPGRPVPPSKASSRISPSNWRTSSPCSSRRFSSSPSAAASRR
ncbi:MAG: hypothetical protein IPK78_20545 [Rhodospirillales bacterium]|nr:hypothetical protein [Rhodospirillales bacterium]